jgi:fructose 1,6-bisphosphatase
MARVTNWLKRLGRPARRRPVTVIASYSVQGSFELWITDEENRVLRCALELYEVIALSGSMVRYLSETTYPKQEE